MTTAAPWQATDDALREQYRRRDAAQQFRHLENHGEQDLRELLTSIEVAERELANIDALIAENERAKELAVTEHQNATAPLQEEIANPKTTTARRVELREKVIEHNATLQAKITALDKSLAAIEVERNYQRSIVGGRPALENRWRDSSPDKERIWTLRKVITLLEQALGDRADNEARQHEIALQNYEARQAKLGYKPIENPQFGEAAELSQKARRARSIADEISRFITMLQAELTERQEKRLAELYT